MFGEGTCNGSGWVESLQNWEAIVCRGGTLPCDPRGTRGVPSPLGHSSRMDCTATEKALMDVLSNVSVDRTDVGSSASVVGMKKGFG